MSRLKVNDEDYTRRLKNFKVECPACGSDNASLYVEYRLYSEGWCNIWIKCDTCEHLHQIFDSDGKLDRAEYRQKKKGETVKTYRKTTYLDALHKMATYPRWSEHWPDKEAPDVGDLVVYTEPKTGLTVTLMVKGVSLLNPNITGQGVWITMEKQEP